MTIKNYKVQDMYYLLKRNNTSLKELLEKDGILFSMRGDINLKQFPSSMLSVTYESPNAASIFEINSGSPKKIGDCKRISWTKEDGISEDDIWEVSINTDLIEYRGEPEDIKELKKV